MSLKKFAYRKPVVLLSHAWLLPWVANGDYTRLPIAHVMPVQIAQNHARMTG